MAGAMRRMGIYLGLVEDDEGHGYGRYEGRPGDYAEAGDDGRYGRYPEGSYQERHDPRHDPRHEGRHDQPGYRSGHEPGYEPAHDRPGAGEPGDPRIAAYAGGEPPRADAGAPRESEAPGVRRAAGPRPLGLAPAPAGPGMASAGGSIASVSSMTASSMTPSSMTGGGSAGRSAGLGSGPVGATAASLAVREAAPAPQPAPAIQPYRITTLHPRTYNEARIIGERFRDGMPVIMNLTEMDDSDAKRLVDFAAGLSFGLRGSIERVTAKVFLLSPRDVDVTAEDKARIREGGFFNQS